MNRIRNYLRNGSVKRKLNFISLSTCAVALVLACATLFGVQTYIFRQTLAHDLMAMAEVVAANSTGAVSFHDKKAGEKVLSALLTRPEIDSAAIVLPEGETFAQVGNASRMAAPAAVESSASAQFRGENCYINQPIQLQGETMGTLLLSANFKAKLHGLVLLYGGLLGLVLAGSFLLAIVLSARLQRLITRPIYQLGSAVKQITEGNDYSVRAERLGEDELGRLTDAFNHMLGRIQAQDEALTLSQRKLEALVNSIDGIVWECTPDTFHFTFVSRQSERLLGYSPDQWLASPSFWHEHLHPEDAPRAIQTCHEAVARRQPYSYEYRMIAADGRVVWIRESGVVLVEQDKPAAVRGIFLDITAQKQAAEQLDKLNRKLLDTSRLAGMSEVATGVLHNVGNVLNSVNVSVNVLNDQLSRSQTANHAKVSSLLDAHRADLAAFLTTDPKGRRVPEFLSHLAAALEEERGQTVREMEALQKNVEHIKEIVAMQQSYAKVAGITEDLPPASLVEDAIRMNEGAFLRHGVTVKREYADAPPVRVDKHKVLQILVNLFRNAKYAMDAAGRNDKVLTLGVGMNGTGRVKVTVRDNGIGIDPEDLTRIFGHGFTTKKDGHGFGLHSGALAAKEIGGSLLANSDGHGTGATFTLELPIAAEKTTANKGNNHERTG